MRGATCKRSKAGPVPAGQHTNLTSEKQKYEAVLFYFL